MTSNTNKISRKDFLNLLGAAGGVIGLNALSPEEGDQVNRMLSYADEAGRPRRPWWIKKVDQPTIEINWAAKQRFSAQKAIGGNGRNLEKYISQTEVDALNAHEAQIIEESIQKSTPGFTLKDFVLSSAFGSDVVNSSTLLGPEVPTPEERRAAQWQGTENEAARIVRSAIRMFGAAQVGFVKLDEDTKKLIYSHDSDGKEIVFEDVDLAYETDEKRVIPNKAKWVISFTSRLSTENMKHAPSMIPRFSTFSGYSRGRYIKSHLQAFISGLGYQCIASPKNNGLGLADGFAVLAGHGEMSRLNRMITPEYGPMVQTFILITDLPVALDRPIDAGIMEFCKVCKKCCESCPSTALSTEDEPSWETRGGWNNPGHKAYFEDSVRCISYWKETASDCSICLSVCPFSKKDSAWMHSWVKAGVATAPQFDGFFRSMDDALSYGAKRDLSDWWYLDLPEFGLHK